MLASECAHVARRPAIGEQLTGAGDGWGQRAAGQWPASRARHTMTRLSRLSARGPAGQHIRLAERPVQGHAAAPVTLTEERQPEPPVTLTVAAQHGRTPPPEIHRQRAAPPDPHPTERDD